MTGETTGETSARGLVFTLLSLLALAGASLGLRYAHLGGLGFAAALGIAAIKAVLVALFFMEIGGERPSVRFAFAAGLGLLALMLSLILADIVTRAPAENPPGTAQRYHG